jgi:pyruvate ferredoxin oxidoreductase gamma subunit
VVDFDVTGLTREVLGRASALSTGLSAAAIRLSGLIELSQLQQATREELEELGVASAEIAKNIEIGNRIFNALSPVKFGPTLLGQSQHLVAPTYQEPRLGTPSILRAGNATLRRTGAWRVDRPVVDRDACTRCGLCFVMCPDGVIQLDEEGYPIVDYDHCKGCMICQRLCPLHAIGRQQETQAW